MKKTLTLLLLLLTGSALMAQSCVPDQTLADSSVGIYPSPYDSLTMTGGIPDEACVNTYYETVIQVRVPETVTISGISVGINNISVSDVSGLPDGLSYACSPEDCSIVPDDSVGCIIIYGVVDAAVTPGDYVIVLEGVVSTGIGDFPLPTIIDLLSAGGGGQSIFIRVNEEGSPECGTATTRQLAADELSLDVFPNPSAGDVRLDINAERASQYDVQLFNLMGQPVYSGAMDVFQGQQTREVNLPHNLPTGMYQLRMSNGTGFVSRNVVIQR